MKVLLHGVRGSYPTSGKDTEQLGGSTSCIELVHEGERLILDAGTGILNIKTEHYNSIKKVTILLTHLHMDHIQGLGFFKLLFDPEKEVHIWGPKSSTTDLYARLGRFISPPIFPVPLRDFPCQLFIHEIEDSPLTIGNFNVFSKYICHPGPTVGYRVEASGKSITYIPDHEPIIGQSKLIDDSRWISGYDLAADTDLLIHDAQFDSEEYFKKIGWGHSSLNHAADFADKTNVKKLIMFHHDPAHTDKQRYEIFDGFMASAKYDFDIELAVQGSEYVL